MYKSKEVTLGSFELESSKIYISDPCYGYDEHDNTCVLTLKEWRQINNPNYTKLLTLPKKSAVTLHPL